MEKYSITFMTACYELDWEFLLKTNYLQEMIHRCGIDFTSKILIINNVEHIAKVELYAQRLVDRNVIDTYYIAADHINVALNFFGIQRTDFITPHGDGYHYSTADYVGLYFCQTPYFLAFTEDAILNKGSNNWIVEACCLMEQNQEYVVANPLWNGDYAAAKSESLNGLMDGNFLVGYGFSDQCYLCRTVDFRDRIYNLSHKASDIYPKRAGEPFEKRVDSWMRINEFKRLTHIKDSYKHKDFPYNTFKKTIKYIAFKLKSF